MPIIMRLKLLFALLIVLPAFHLSAFEYAYEGKTLSYVITDPDARTCMVSQNPDIDGILSIPEVVSLDGIDYTVTSICEFAFKDCGNLTSVIIPPTVRFVGEDAFGGCRGLVKNAYPSTLNDPFPTNRGKTKNISYNPEDIMIEDDIIYNGEMTTIVFVPLDFEGDLISPESVTSVGDYSFLECHGLTSFKNGESVQTIGNAAFYNCSALAMAELGDGLLSIGDHAFFECSSLATIKVGRSLKTIGNSAFNNCSELTYFDFSGSLETIGSFSFKGCSSLTSIEIGDLVQTIDEYAFEKCKGLTSIVMGNSVKTIGSHAFAGCEGLTSLVLDHSVETIGNSAFIDCNGLISLELSNSVKLVEERAFYCCRGLESVMIGASVESISDKAFYGCHNLKSVLCEADKPLEGCSSEIFSNTAYESAVLYVPEGSMEQYSTTSPWSLFNSIAVGGSGVDDIIADMDSEMDPSVPCMIFDMNGRDIANTINGLSKGVYIVLQNKVVRKIVVK